MMNKLGAVSLVALMLAAGAAQAEELPVVQPDQVEGGATIDVAAQELSSEILLILNDQRPLAEMKPGELRKRFRDAAKLAKQPGLTDDVRQSLEKIALDARAEFEARQQQTEQPVEAPAAEPPAEVAQPEAVPAQPAEEAAPVEGTTAEQPAAELPAVEQPAEPEAQPEAVPVQPVEEAQPEAAPAQPVQEAQPETAPEQPVEQPVENATAPPTQSGEQPIQEAAPAQPAQPETKAQAQTDANPVSPEAEQQARRFLADKTPANELSDDQLRQRLEAMRDLMAQNALSPKTERALRQKLQQDRQILRKRVAARKAQEEQKAAEGVQPQPAPSGTKKPVVVEQPEIAAEAPPRRVLEDRRRSEELAMDELRRRVDIYVTFERSNDFESIDEQTRREWRERARRDRAILRSRMLEERARRAEELARNAEDDRIEIQIEPSGRPPRSVFEAEADDQELEDILVAAPAKRVQKRLTVEDLAAREDLRESMPRIEIDTIRFGFNEAFVREEEIDNLDRVAGIIERVLRQRPGEVFLIEGHTDAVGSGVYNTQLSRARAEAVKKALTSYYVIPERNLRTVGLGERYLRIPTLEAEAENRRVSLSRITAYVGELEQ